jgi:hypothetical protein
MSAPSDAIPSNHSAPIIAGHSFALQDRGKDVLSLRIALGGVSLVALAGSLARLSGVRVTGGPEGASRQRGYLVHCLGFRMVLSAPADGTADVALALVSRAPHVGLAMMSDLASVLERLMTETPQLSGPAPIEPPRRSALQQGKPLARKTELKRKTPLARSPFKRR